MEVTAMRELDDGSAIVSFVGVTEKEWLAYFRYGRALLPDCWDEGTLIETAVTTLIREFCEEILEANDEDTPTE